MKSGMFGIIAGPAGVGKTTLMPLVMARLPQAVAMISTTSRPPRPDEVDGVHYRFLTLAEFMHGIGEERFIEHAEYADNRYGTDARELQELLTRAPLVVKILELEGVRTAKRKVPGCQAAFLMPESLDQLEARLRQRKGATEQDIAKRLAIARIEIAAVGEFDFVAVNREGDLEACADALAAYFRQAAGLTG